MDAILLEEIFNVYGIIVWYILLIRTVCILTGDYNRCDSPLSKGEINEH
jgi:hypothetical protein